MKELHSALLVTIAAAVTIALRALPFALFRDKTPKAVLDLGRVLPCAVMAMLVVYCLRGVSFGEVRNWLPSLCGCAAVFALHKRRHETLLSILGGTAVYMLLLRLL